MKFREKILESGAKLLLGKDENSNDELVKQYESKENTILHTAAPGSPFGVIVPETKSGKPAKADIYEAGVFVAKHSQDWRDNKEDVIVSVFNGISVTKPKGAKPGLWKVNSGKASQIKIKKKDILKIN